MARISRSPLFMCIVVCLLPVIHGTHYPYDIYGDDPCGASYTVSKDAMFSFHKLMQLFVAPNCTTTFQATNGAQLVTRFLTYNIDSSYINEKGNCSTEFIQLYNSSGSPLIGPTPEYCGSETPSSEYLLGVEGQFTRNIKVRFGIIITTAVQVLLTEVVVKNPSCPAGYFDCQNNYCVDNDVTCNDYDDCGNNNDEDDGCEFSPGAVAGIVVGSVVLFPILIYVICVLVIKSRKHSR